MLKVNTYFLERYKIIKIEDDQNAFEIMYGGNGDLYFAPSITRMELLEGNEPITFIIEEIDSELYPIFNHLYNKILSYQPFDKEDEDDDFFNLNEFDNSEYERKKDLYRKYPLVQNETISWHSDEDESSISSILNIKKEKDKIILEFLKSKNKDPMYQTYSIRIRNSGSSYSPFNCRFMELYNTLCTIDFNYHQITINEYMIEQQRKLKKLVDNFK